VDGKLFNTTSMKLSQISTVLFFGLLFVLPVQSQKAGFVNVQVVLEKVPEYGAAQEKLNELTIQYTKEVKTKKKDIQQMYSSYQADKILLSAEMRTKKEEKIKEVEIQLEQLKAKRFGENGDLFKERQKLIKPIQDKVYSSIKAVAEKKGFAFIVDVTSELGILYYNEKYDKTQDVLKKMGYL
jgi:outer membrane protein